MSPTVRLSGISSVEKTIYFLKWVFSVACSVGFASCKTFGKQPKHPCFGAEPPYRSSAICATASCSGFVWLTASILAWSRGGSPTLSPGTDAGRVCPRALQGRIQVVGQSRCRTHRQQTTTIAQMQSQPSIHCLSPGGRGFRQGCRNKDTPSFARGKAIRVS